METRTFTGGMEIPHLKEYTAFEEVKPLVIPDRVVVPLLQHLGEPCKPLVEVGDKVKVGEKIGDSEEYWSAPVHASIAGEVTAIEPRPYYTGEKINSVEIRVDRDAQQEFHPEEKRDPENMSIMELKECIKEGGGVGMGGAACPTYVNLDQKKPVETLILNGSECEPFLTCDHRQMVEKCEELIAGAEILMRIIRADHCYIGIEENKPDAIEIISEAVRLRKDMEVVPLAARYPQGYKKMLIRAVTGKEPPRGARSADVGCIVRNVNTTIAAYEAVVYGKPCFERVITVSGPRNISSPGNYMIRIGTPIKCIFDECGVGDLAGWKVVMGGAMTGTAVDDLEVPVIKSTTGVLVLPPEMIRKSRKYSPCIRCGRCVEYCPMFLYPNQLSVLLEADMYEASRKWDIDQCAECGLCAYVCPARRPIMAMIRRGKREIKAAN